MKPQLGVIIVSYNVKEFLFKCIISVQQDCPDAEILVVDNNSSDGSTEMIKQNFSAVKLIENKENKGFSPANNQGISISHGEYILLLNPDTEVLPGTISKMLDYISHTRENSIIAPQLLNADMTVQISAWWFPTAWEIFFEAFFIHKLVCISEYPPSIVDQTFEANTLSGAALMFRTTMKEKFLDENLFWMEDVDLCYRNKNSGGKNIYFPEAKIIHHIGQSSKKNYRIAISNQLISKLKFFKKHKKYLSFSFSSIFIFIHILLRIVIFAVFSSFLKKFQQKLDAYRYTLIKFLKYIFTGYASIN